MDGGGNAGAAGTMLTQEEQDLWLAHLAAADGAAHTLALAWELIGAVDVDALGGAFDDLVRRHESLRLTIPARSAFGEAPGSGGTVLVEVQPPRSGSLTVDEAPGSDGASVEEWLRQRVTLPYDLGSGEPLLRAWLRPGPGGGRSVLLMTVHHLAADAWSLALLRRDLGVAYRQRLPPAGRPAAAPCGDGIHDAPALPEVPGARQARARVPTVQYAVGTRREPGGSATAPGPQPPGLPVDTADGGPAGPAARHRVAVPADDIAALGALCRSRRVTPFMVLEAAFGAFLARWCNSRTDLIVASPRADRPPGLEDAVGFLLHTMHLTTRAGGDPRFAELLADTRAQVLADLAGVRLPGVPPGRDRAAVLFSMLNTPRHELELDGVHAHPRHVGQTVTSRELVVEVGRPADSAAPDALEVAFEYRADRWQGDSIAAAARAYLRVLSQVLRDEETRLSRLQLADGDEVAVAARGRFAAGMRAPGMLELLSRVVDERADGTAAVCGGVRLSYARLWQEAGALAGALQRAGVRRGDVVASRVPRGCGLLVSLVGILRAGCTYLPLDPAHPAVRSDAVVSAAQAAAVVRALPGTPAAGPALTVDRTPGPPPPGLPRAGGAAYLMYTSGSTGTPKGVAVSHASLAVFLRGITAVLDLTAADTVLASTTVTFDISLLELLAPLAVGATCVVADGRDAGDVRALARLADRHRASVVQATPSVWRLLVGELRHRPRVALCGGEPMSEDLRERLHRLPQALNLYGPTEATVWATTWTVGDGPVSVGHPLPGYEVLVLDAWGQPAPDGTPGDVGITGAALADGYLDRPDLTSTAFVPGPPGTGRVYRTGDRGRLRRGSRLLDILGRDDEQVKVRGHRVELGEVETHLRALPGVRDAAAVTRPSAGGALLVAFVVTDPGAGLGAASLLARLREQVPSFLVPTEVHLCRSLPLVPAGKVDRPALVALARELTREPAGATDLQPREAAVAELWAAVLEHRRFGPDDSFFDVGGDSLSAVRLLASARHALGVELALADFLRDPTVTAMATRSGLPSGARTG